MRGESEMSEAMKQALEALEQWNTPLYKRGTAIETLRQAIAELESQEPVAWRWKTHNGYAYSEQHYEGEDGQPLYTHPPQRTWQGLTDEEIWQIATDSTIGGDLHADKFAKAIEAKLKEKNNG